VKCWVGLVCAVQCNEQREFSLSNVLPACLPAYLQSDRSKQKSNANSKLFQSVGLLEEKKGGGGCCTDPEMAKEGKEKNGENRNKRIICRCPCQAQVLTWLHQVRLLLFSFFPFFLFFLSPEHRPINSP